MKEKKELKCHHCKYKWIRRNPTTDLYYVTCPRCYYKVKIKQENENKNMC